MKVKENDQDVALWNMEFAFCISHFLLLLFGCQTTFASLIIFVSVIKKKKKKTLQRREKRGARHKANLLTPPKYLCLIKTHPSSLTNLINSACRGFHTDNVILHSNLLA